jgi:3-dehydroquinate synthetase
MQIDKYPVIVGASSMVYEFISEGKRGKISKIVIYSETHLNNFYNLGFGDKDENTGAINDSVVTNNGDSEKVLATVAATLYEFTDKFPEAMIFAIGSTKARTRLYKIGITNNINSIKPDF